MIFVFGSNLDGNHAGGAARFACINHGAYMGVAEGMTGESYAIPTVGHNFTSMSFGEVFEHVRTFINVARQHPELYFNVTRIGCGIAGFKDEDIAPIFADAPKNCRFDEAWRQWLPFAKFWGTI